MEISVCSKPLNSVSSISAMMSPEIIASTIVWTGQNEWLPANGGASLQLTEGRQFAINKGAEAFPDGNLLETARTNPNGLVSIARPSSNHSGGVNATFADGHVEFLSDEIHPWVYARRLTPNRNLARLPDSSAYTPDNRLRVQVLPQDPNGLVVDSDY